MYSYSTGESLDGLITHSPASHLENGGYFFKGGAGDGAPGGDALCDVGRELYSWLADGLWPD